jgi:hypothetical protein
VEALHLEFEELQDIPFKPALLSDILLKIGVRTDFKKLGEFSSLKHLRSLYHPINRKLLINKGLNEGQKNFLLGREIAFQWLKIKERPLETPPQSEKSFEAILNNYRASYFSAALIMPKKNVIPDTRAFASLPKWDEQRFLSFITRYDATPEMIMQRLTNLLPTYFNLQNLYFHRFLKSNKKYFLTKELHLSGKEYPQANELNEHYCRRWLGIRQIETLERNKGKLSAGVQFTRHVDTNNEYFNISIAFQNVSNRKEHISVTIGFLNDRTLSSRIKFLKDPSIQQQLTGATCERCPISDCEVRAAEPYLYRQNKDYSDAEMDIGKILEEKN